MELLPAMSAPENSTRAHSPLPEDPIAHVPKPAPISLSASLEISPATKVGEHSSGSSAIHPPIGKSIEHMPPKKAHLLMLQAQYSSQPSEPAHAAMTSPPPPQPEPASHATASAEPASSVQLPVSNSQPHPQPQPSVSPATAEEKQLPPTTPSASVSAHTAEKPSTAASLPPAVAPSAPVPAAAATSSPASRVTFATMRDMVQAALLLQPQCTAALPAIYSFVERFGRILTKGGVERHLTAQKNWKSSIRSTLYQNNIFMRAGAEGSWQIVPSRIDERPEISFGTVTLEQLRALAAVGGPELHQPAPSTASRASPPPSPPGVRSSAAPALLPTPSLSSAPVSAPNVTASASAVTTELPHAPAVRAVKSETSSAAVEVPQRRPLMKPAAASHTPAALQLEKKPQVRPPASAALKQAAPAVAKHPTPVTAPAKKSSPPPQVDKSEPTNVLFGEKDLRAIKGFFERPNSILGAVPLHLLVNPHSWALLSESEHEQLRAFLPEVDRSDEAFQQLLKGHNMSFVQYAQLFGSMLRSGTFDPLMAPQRAAAKRARERDPWKSEHYEDTWGEQLMQSLWADYAANATAAAARSNVHARATAAQAKAQPPSPPRPSATAATVASASAAGAAAALTAPAAPSSAPAFAAGPALAAVMHSVGETITKIEKVENEDELVDIGGDDDSLPAASTVATSLPRVAEGPDVQPPTANTAAVVVAPPVAVVKKASLAAQYLQDLPDDDEDDQDEPDDELWKPAPRNHHAAAEHTHHHPPKKGIAAHVLRRAGAPPSKAKKKKPKVAAGLRSPFAKSGSQSSLVGNKRKLGSSSSGPISITSPISSGAIPRSLLPLKKQLMVRAAVEAAAAPPPLPAPDTSVLVTPKKKLKISKIRKKQKLETPKQQQLHLKKPQNLLRRSLQTPSPAVVAKKRPRPRSRSPSPNLPSPHVAPTFPLRTNTTQEEPPHLAAPLPSADHSLLGPPVYNSAAAARALAKEPTRRQLQALVAEDELRQLQSEALLPPVKKRRPSNVAQLLAGVSVPEGSANEHASPDATAPAPAHSSAAALDSELLHRPHKHHHPHPLEGGHTAVHPTPTKAVAQRPAASLLRSSTADDEVIDIMFSDEGKTETAWT